MFHRNRSGFGYSGFSAISVLLLSLALSQPLQAQISFHRGGIKKTEWIESGKKFYTVSDYELAIWDGRSFQPESYIEFDKTKRKAISCDYSDSLNLFAVGFSDRSVIIYKNYLQIQKADSVRLAGLPVSVRFSEGLQVLYANISGDTAIFGSAKYKEYKTLKIDLKTKLIKETDDIIRCGDKIYPELPKEKYLPLFNSLSLMESKPPQRFYRLWSQMTDYQFKTAKFVYLNDTILTVWDLSDPDQAVYPSKGLDLYYGLLYYRLPEALFNVRISYSGNEVLFSGKFNSEKVIRRLKLEPKKPVETVIDNWMITDDFPFAQNENFLINASLTPSLTKLSYRGDEVDLQFYYNKDFKSFDPLNKEYKDLKNRYAAPKAKPGLSDTVLVSKINIGHRYPVEETEIFPERDLLMSYSNADMIVWERSTRRELFRFNSTGKNISDACFNKSMNHLLMADADSMIIFNLDNFEIIKTIRFNRSDIDKIQVTPDGILVFSGLLHRFNKNYNLLSKLNTNGFHMPAVSKDGQIVYIIDGNLKDNAQNKTFYETSITAISLRTFDTLMVYKLPESFEYRFETTSKMNNSGNQLAVCNGTRLLIFDLQNNKPVHVFDSVYRHKFYYEFFSMDLLFSPDDKKIMSFICTDTQGNSSPSFATVFDIISGEKIWMDQSVIAGDFLNSNEIAYLTDTITWSDTNMEMQYTMVKKVDLHSKEQKTFSIGKALRSLRKQEETLYLLSAKEILELNPDLSISKLFGGSYNNIEAIRANKNHLILLSKGKLSAFDLAASELQLIKTPGDEISEYDFQRGTEFLNDDEMIFFVGDSLLYQFGISKKELREIKNYGYISDFLLSPLKRYFAVGKRSGAIDLYDLQANKKMLGVNRRSEIQHLGEDYFMYVIENMENSIKDTLKIFDLSSGKTVNSLPDWYGFTPYSTDRIDQLSGNIIRGEVTNVLYENKTLNVINSYPKRIIGNAGDLVFAQSVKNEYVNPEGITSVYSKKNKSRLYSVPGLILESTLSREYFFTYENNKLWMWNAGTGELVYDYTLRTSVFTKTSAILENYGKLLIIDGNGILHFFDIKARRWISLYLFDESNWLAISQDGLFDGTDKSFGQLFFMKDNNTIGLDQLKSRFYEPGLLAKFMGYNEEPLRAGENLNTLELYPEVKTFPIENGLLYVDLYDRGGGIGKVIVTINRKEIDIIPENRAENKGGKKPVVFRSAGEAASQVNQSDSDKGNKLELAYNLNGHPYILPGVENEIEVKAYNAENWLVSRGVKEMFKPASSKTISTPNLYAIIAGASNYRGDGLDLGFASKDASDFAGVLGNSSGRLFGVGNTFITLLNTDGAAVSYPTRENLKKAVEGIAAKAQAGDIFIFYLAGHGTNWGGQDGDFYYLTPDASDGNLNDPAIRNTVAVSGSELTQWFKQVAALKQVLIMDVCHSGKLADDLMGARGDVSSSVLRSYERMKDRTGMYILAGSAADAVSYETSVYGQGLLTYSLIFGMKGAALRDGEFVDVITLFQHSADQVPQLAQGIGGIQRPQVRTPYGGQSFDIGRITAEDQSKITLKAPKPMFLRSSFQDEIQMDDILGISEALDTQMRELSSRGGETNLVFIDASRFSQAYKVTGRYTSVQGKITANIVLRKGDEQVIRLIVEAANAEELVKKTVEEVMKVAKR